MPFAAAVPWIEKDLLHPSELYPPFYQQVLPDLYIQHLTFQPSCHCQPTLPQH